MNPALHDLLEANRSFYTAFESMDLSRMKAVWAQREADICIHPGWDILHGWPEIRESWRAIFAGTSFMRVELTGVSAEIIGSVGRVSCIESLFSVIDSQTEHSQIACTNLFIQQDGAWRMILHQGSPVAAQPVLVQDLSDTDIN